MVAETNCETLIFNSEQFCTGLKTTPTHNLMFK